MGIVGAECLFEFLLLGIWRAALISSEEAVFSEFSEGVIDLGGADRLPWRWG